MYFILGKKTIISPVKLMTNDGLFTVHSVVIGISDIYWFLSKSASTFVFFSFFNPLFEYFELILLRLNNLALDLKYLTIQTM